MTAAALPMGRREPALGPSIALSALTHTILIAVLFLGVRFTSSPPATVEVELWEPPPPAPPAPVVEAPKPPPPPPVVKPEPEPEVKKPDIALAEKPKPKPKPEPKVEKKPPPPKPQPKRDPNFDKMLKEQAALEQKQLAAAEQERQMRDMLARQQAAAQAAQQRALASGSDKIRARVRGYIILPQEIPGNPEAIFDVALLPNGEVLTVRKRKSSGNPGYDEAVERAILKSSPLPLPDDRSVFRRDLELKFRPQDR